MDRPGGFERIVAGSEIAGKRIDAALAQILPDLTRSHLQKLIEEGLVTVAGKPVKRSYRLAEGDEITVEVPPPREPSLTPEDIPLDVRYEDGDIIIVNKPRGLVVHPAPGHSGGTLVNALLAHCKDLEGINDVIRPGIVHRLDKDTTGLLVAAKNERAQRSLAKQIKERTVRREYLALVHGGIEAGQGIIEAPIGRNPRNRKLMDVVKDGRQAVTEFEVLERYPGYTLLRARLRTGRTHQIRVHMAHIGHPVAGDPAYGPRKKTLPLKGQALHAERLGFMHPSTGEAMEFSAEPPADFRAVLAQLRGG